MKKELVALVVAMAFMVSPANAEDPYDFVWGRQLGTTAVDDSRAVVADAAGNVFISGMTKGSLDGTNAGDSDAFVSKYDASGSILWTRQLGTSGGDFSNGVVVDVAGNVFISGYTNGSLDGTNAGSYDAFVSKYNASGNILWTRQLGTPSWDRSSSVEVDADGNVLISGYTNGSLDGTNAGGYDAFVSKYDALGNALWTRQLGTPSNDYSYGVTTDAIGNVFISGTTEGGLEGTNAGDSDAFVSKYDGSGNILWTRQLGTTAHDSSAAVAADAAGNVFISGLTKGSLDGTNAGEQDAFVSKYDASGNILWTRQLGTSSRDLNTGVAVDAAENVFVCGYSDGSLGGPNAGDWDVFVSKYGTLGDLLWTRQLGTSSLDLGRDVAADEDGSVFITGRTDGDLYGTNPGIADGFVAKLAVPEPATLGLLLIGSLALLRRKSTTG